MQQVKESIYKNLNLNPTSIFAPKYGKLPAIYIADIVDALLIYGTGPKAISSLGRGERTFNKYIKQLFPNVKLQGGGETWAWYLISQSDYKYCGSCGSYKLRKFFGKDQSTSDNLCVKCQDCRKVSNAKWYKNNKDYHVDYVESHRAEYNARNAKRRALLLERTVKWANLQEIEKFYINCPKGFHVDHYYPLQGENVCGLHVLENLQYLSAKDNMSKGNKMPE